MNFQRFPRYLNNEILIILNLYGMGFTLPSDKQIFIFCATGKNILWE